MAEMLGNAEAHGQQRGERLRKAAELDAVGDGQLVANTAGVGGRDGGDAFLKVGGWLVVRMGLARFRGSLYC